MRFEIGAWGIFLLLVGLAGLSGSIFLLGMFAGYEVARQDQQNTNVAMVLPIPASPVPSFSASVAQTAGAESTATPSIASSPQPAVPSVAPSVSRPLPPVIANRSTTSAPSVVGSEVAPPTAGPAAVTGSTPGAVTTLSKASPAGPVTASTARSGPLQTPVAAPTAAHVGPYSVEIQAAMDGQAALQLVQKLRSMGYPAYSVEKQIGGQTWYKVRVGHFASRAEAEAAEERLHQQLNGALTTR